MTRGRGRDGGQSVAWTGPRSATPPLCCRVAGAGQGPGHHGWSLEGPVRARMGLSGARSIMASPSCVFGFAVKSGLLTSQFEDGKDDIGPRSL